MKKNESIMAPSDKKAIIQTYDNTFLNAKCLFVEYYDVIRTPWYSFMLYTINDKELNIKNLFDLSEIKYLSELGLMEWYMYRDYRNPLSCLPANPNLLNIGKDETYSKSYLNQLLEQFMDNPDIMKINRMVEMPFLSTLYNLLYTSVVDNIYVYTPIYHKTIEEDIEELFSNKVGYVYGDLEDVLKKVNTDTTYVFSDILHINTLININRLDYSSILVADYWYNYTTTFGNPEMPYLKVDIDRLLNNDHVFHFGCFDNGFVFI